MSRSPDELRAMNVIDAEYESAVEAEPMPTFPQGINQLRKARSDHLSARRAHFRIRGPIPDLVTETDRTVPARDGHPIPIRIYTPITKSEDGDRPPIYVAYHEGGWALGDLADEEMNCRLYARDLGVVCVNVQYRLAPEHPFPTGIHDALDALRWIASNAASLGADPARGFVVGGASAGGNLAAVLGHVARDEGLTPGLTGLHLVCPALFPPESVPDKYAEVYISARENVHDPVLKFAASKGGIYEGSAVRKMLKADLESPLFNVLANEKGQGGLPACYLQVCGLDPLRDEGLIFESILREDCGGQTRMDVYAGFGHMFWTNYPKMQRSKEFVDDAMEGLRWLLSRAR